ncbi:hypothetical protein DPX16_4561 [Anabarilius grahami]|uniref:Uncharacterized protein n=1 Tax=Anabarilius grahami TaxID=495550 RepID=A0A3N0YBY8_ANAGA|nr:hypothetical protein DPX16_4561 [Anabarilius grahami]
MTESRSLCQTQPEASGKLPHLHAQHTARKPESATPTGRSNRSPPRGSSDGTHRWPRIHTLRRAPAYANPTRAQGNPDLDQLFTPATVLSALSTKERETQQELPSENSNGCQKIGKTGCRRAISTYDGLSYTPAPTQSYERHAGYERNQTPVRISSSRRCLLGMSNASVL